MSNTAKFVKEITVVDPDSGEDVNDLYLED